MTSHAIEVAKGERFEFGANWSRFLAQLDDRRIEEAKKSLREMLGVDSLAGRSFMDIGSGSGLFSLAARLLGARVHSFDYDPRSVACTAELKRRYFPGDPSWAVEQGSVLDQRYLAGLGKWDIVYSWGVLHHTGQMWQALENVSSLVGGKDGRLFIAIYNDQGGTSRRWLAVKKAYNGLPEGLRFLVIIPSMIRLWVPQFIRDLLQGSPLRTWRTWSEGRGMSPWTDLVDWVGGYPFEVATPEEIFSFYRLRGFHLEKMTTTQSLGCNQFVFSLGEEPSRPRAAVGQASGRTKGQENRQEAGAETGNAAGALPSQQFGLQS